MDGAADTGIPPALEAYLLSHRGMMAPVVAVAVASLRLPADGVVLDAGTGAGGALAPLLDATPDGRVLGVDADPRVLTLAAGPVTDHAARDRVDLRAADVASILADPPSGGFAAIWSSELLWPGNVGPPAATVAAIAGALAPAIRARGTRDPRDRGAVSAGKDNGPVIR